MKEATGELNATVFVVTVVGFLMAFFYFTVWPIIKSNFNRNANCAKAICETCKDKNGCEYVTCHIKGQKETFECVYKG